MSKKKTVVLGATPKASTFAHRAVKSLTRKNHPVIPIGISDGEIEGIKIEKEPVHDEDVDTVTLYLRPERQVQYYDYILSLKPKRIIFNPGTENPELIKLATENNIQPVIGCTLVMLATGEY